MPTRFFMPGRDPALRHLSTLHARFRDSLDHLLERCAGHVPFDAARATALVARLERPERVPPALIGQYFEAVAAIDAADLPGVRSAIDGLMAFDPEEVPEALRIRPLNPDTFSGDGEATFRRHFVGEGLDDRQIGHLSGAAAAKACDEIGRSLALLERTAPDSHAEMATLISEIVPARGMPLDEFEFDGASSLKRWGAILINMSRPRSRVELAETLVHEAAHASLFAMSPLEFYVENGADERYPSPLRVDPRPLDGIYHATFVLARMHHAMREVASCEAATQAHRDEARHLAQRSSRNFFDSLSVLADHARYTPTGREIMAETEAYMREVAA